MAADQPVHWQRHVTWAEPGDWVHHPPATIQSCALDFPTPHDAHVMVVHYEPATEVEPHLHNSDYCSIVVAGSIEITRRTYTVGDIRLVQAGTAYGPLVAGPEGCTVVDIFMEPDARLVPVGAENAIVGSAAAP